MNQAVDMNEATIIDQAMTAFFLDAVKAKHKCTKLKVNMECRRKLEMKWEEKRLAKEILEFEFN